MGCLHLRVENICWELHTDSPCLCYTSKGEMLPLFWAHLLLTVLYLDFTIVSIIRLIYYCYTIIVSAFRELESHKLEIADRTCLC